MKSPNEVKLEILEEFEESFDEMPTSALWYTPVKGFLSQSLNRLQASIVENLPEPKALKDYDVMGFEDHYDRGKVNGFNQALKEVLDLLTKSQ